MQNQHGCDILGTNPPPFRLCLLLSSVWMYDVWYDSSNKDMDERMEEAGGCN